VPAAWTRWLVILLPKPGQPTDLLGKRRDIYLQPHSLKLFMNGLKPEYDMTARRTMANSQAGFRPGRNAPESSLVLALQREQAVAERRPWYRGMIDFKGFFMSIVRTVQDETERRSGVRPEVTDAVLALHAALQVSYDTGAGLTPGVDSLKGVGQGDTDGPVRSMITLAALQKAVDWLVPGFRFAAPHGAAGMRVPQVFFADDGSFLCDDFGTLQTSSTSCQWWHDWRGWRSGWRRTARRRRGWERNG